MAVPFLIIALGASLGAFGDAETAYNRCLATEVEVAVERRVDRDRFVRGVPEVCAEEAAVYRRMAVAAMVGQGMAGASPEAADARFAATDRANRADMIASFDSRMRMRRGPARVAGLTVNRADVEE